MGFFHMEVKNVLLKLIVFSKRVWKRKSKVGLTLMNSGTTKKLQRNQDNGFKHRFKKLKTNKNPRK